MQPTSNNHFAAYFANKRIHGNFEMVHRQYKYGNQITAAFDEAGPALYQRSHHGLSNSRLQADRKIARL